MPTPTDPPRAITESPNPAAAHLDSMTTRALVQLMNDEDARVAPAVGRALDAIAGAIDAIAARMEAGGRLVYVGAGTSGRLGVLDASECPPTFGIAADRVVGVIAGGEAALTRASEGAEDEEAPAHAALARLGVGAKDAVVALSASGRTPFAIAALIAAQKAGALTVAVACNPNSPLAAAAEHAIEVVPGPEIVAGSTRLKAGTATKLVLNMLSTGAMVRLGRVRGAQMVDLRPGSRKLVERAARIVVELGGVTEERARALLAAHGGQPRAALDALARERPAATPNATGAPAAGHGWLAGIDGGGSKTAIALAPPVGVAARPAWARLAQPCNLATHFAGALTAIEEAIAVASATADRPAGPLAALVVAAAGSGDAELRARASARLLERRVAERVAIVHDAAPLLVAATRDGVGLALICGTGSFCFGRDGQGRVARAGGLGALLGDDGSAYELGRAALRAAARAADGRGAKLALVRAVFAAVGSDDPRAIVRWAWERREPARIAELAPLVIDACEAGDLIAERLIARAAAELALMAKTVVRKLELDGAAAPLVLSGGVFDHSSLLRRRVVASLKEMGVAVAILPSADAAQGALQLARDLQGGRLTEAQWFPAEPA